MTAFHPKPDVGLRPKAASSATWQFWRCAWGGTPDDSAGVLSFRLVQHAPTRRINCTFDV